MKIRREFPLFCLTLVFLLTGVWLAAHNAVTYKYHVVASPTHRQK